MDFGSIINNPLDQMALLHLEADNYAMIVVALAFLYLATKRRLEPLLLIPIAFDMLLTNICPDTIYSPEQTSNGTGGFLWYFLQLDKRSISSSLISLGVGAIMGFGPPITNPVSFLTGVATQLGVCSAYFFAILLGFSGKESTTISITDGADGPTSPFLCSKLGQTQIVGPTAVATYSYMALVPIIQPLFMKLLTAEKERKIKMEQLRPVSRLERVLFLIIVTIVVYLILPSTAPLVGMLVLGNLFREGGVTRQPADTASNALMYIVVILSSISIGTTTSAEVFLNVATIRIVTLDLAAFIFGTADGVLLGKLLCKITGREISPLIGSAGMSAVSMAARVFQKAGAEADLTNFLLIYVMGPNIAGVIGTAVAAGTFMAIFGT